MGMVVRKTRSEIIEEAFGGERKLWPLPGPWGPGVSRFQVAMTRVSKKTPLGLSPLECLRFWGFAENKVTRGLFYLTENYERLFEGRIIAVTLAKKWIMNVFKSGARKVTGEELNENNRMEEVQSVSLQYFPVVETNPGDTFVNNELEFCILIARDIDE